MGHMDRYDVIIVGGSFAGLSTAYFTEADKILILEKMKQLGERQKSTCCTSVEWIERLGCENSILKTFDTMTFHSPNDNEATIPLPETFATIDYSVFCQTLAIKLKNTEIKTGEAVTGVEPGPAKKVITQKAEYEGEILVDCSGWRAVIANKLRSGRYFDNKKLSYGIEVETPYSGDTSTIHIYYGKGYIPNGYGWIFPTGEDRARIGLGGYKGKDLNVYMERFLDYLEVESGASKPHGGVLPCQGLREPVVGDVFVVGDASGGVLPLTGEGIRKSLEYGEICGKAITKVLKGELKLSEGLNLYREMVMNSEKFYNDLSFTQNLFTSVPDWAREKIISDIKKIGEGEINRFLNAYFNDAIRPSKLKITKVFVRGLLA